VVGHLPGLAQGRAQQVQALTPEQAHRLLTDAGRDAVALAGTLDLTAAGRLRTLGRLREVVDAELSALALEQALLRRRAVAKHPRGAELWWTPDALEQASSWAAARWRARRYPNPVVDLCCSVGGDLLALPEGSLGVDLDAARLLLARANAEVLGRRVGLVRADVSGLPLPRAADVFVDPARRSGGRRRFDPRDYTPPLDTVLDRRSRLRRLGVKAAPGLDHEALPDDVEVEVVSLHGDVKEAVLWAGAARSGSRKSAALLPAGDVLVDERVPPAAVGAPGGYLLEPDGAVIRAHLVQQLAARVGGRLVDPTIAYLTGDAPEPTPFGRWYRVHEVMPFSLKALRARLRALDAGTLVVKKRGTAVEPEELRRRLRLTGSRETTVVLTRVQGRQVAMIVSPVLAAAGQPAEQPPDAAADAVQAADGALEGGAAG
jgi:hypothetical protein